jgi:hypothetical protein
VPAVDLVHAGPAKHRRPVEQQQARAAGLGHRLQESLAAADQRRFGRHLRHPFGLPLHHRAQQRLLVREMVVERAARHARRRDDFRRPRPGIGLFHEQPARRRDEFGARRLRPLPVRPPSGFFLLHTCSLYVN